MSEVYRSLSSLLVDANQSSKIGLLARYLLTHVNLSRKVGGLLDEEEEEKDSLLVIELKENCKEKII